MSDVVIQVENLSKYRIPVHFAGQPCDMPAIGALAERDGSRIIEDASNAIGVNVHYIPAHTQPDYQRLGFRRGDYPVAAYYESRALSLPLFPSLTEAQQDHVRRRLDKALP